MPALGAAVVLAFGLGSWVAYHATRAVNTGVARAARGVHYDRVQQPGWFWCTVVGQFAIALGCALLIIRLLSQAANGGA